MAIGKNTIGSLLIKHGHINLLALLQVLIMGARHNKPLQSLMTGQPPQQNPLILNALTMDIIAQTTILHKEQLLGGIEVVVGSLEV